MAQEVADTMFLNDAAGSRRIGHITGVDANSFKVEVASAPRVRRRRSASRARR